MSVNIKQLLKKSLHQLGYDISITPVGNKSFHQNKNVVFVHIPKSGGMSIDQALREKLARPGERKIKRKPLINTNLATYNKKIKSLEDSCNFSEYHNNENSRILRYHMNLHWRYISGHLTVNQKIIEDFHASYQFITVLREPISRYISNYLYNKLTNTSDIMLPNNLQNMTVETAINEAKSIITNRRGWQMANTMSLFITGRYPKNENDASTLQQEFSKNLSKFSVVGFLSDLSGFSDQVSTIINQPITIPHKNSVNTHLNESLIEVHEALKHFFSEQSTLKQLQDLCRYDIENYQNALQTYGSK